jgi:hypothetical protein
MHPRAGWIWTPATVWGPAWVSWRYSEGYCGWAPLPPEAFWAPGIGLTFRGRHVSATFDFGLGFHHYAFVSIGSFCDPHPYRHLVPRTQVVNVYRNTTVVNNYTVVNNTVINRGVGRETIARHSQAEIRQVKVQPASFATGADRASRLERRGNDLVAYRPQLPKDPPVQPAVIQRRMAQDIHQTRVASTPAAVAPRVARESVGEPRTIPSGAPRAATPAPGRVESRPNAPARVEPARPEPRNVQPRNVPARPERNERSAVVPEPRNNVARATEAPAATPPPRVQTPSAAPSQPLNRAYPEARTATPPATPRAAQPTMSPRYAEQYNSRPGASAPAYGRPDFTPRAQESVGSGGPHAAGSVGHGGAAPATRGDIGGNRGEHSGRAERNR